MEDICFIETIEFVSHMTSDDRESKTGKAFRRFSNIACDEKRLLRMICEGVSLEMRL